MPLTAAASAERRAWAVAWGLALAVALFYGVASRGSGFLYDDELLIVDAPVPRDGAGWARLFSEPHYLDLPYYRPLARISYLLQKVRCGADPRSFHRANAALAGIALLAAYFVLRAPRLGIGRAPALLAASAVVLHPAFSSCVLPIAGRDSLLPFACGLAAVGAWLRPGPGWGALAVGGFALALFGKEQAVVLPAVLLLADALRLGPRRSAFGRTVLYGLLVLPLALYLGLRRVALPDARLELALAHDPGGPLESLAFAIQSLFAPFAELRYEPPLAGFWSPPRTVLSILVLGLLLGAAWRARARVGRAALYWCGWFVLALAPAANVFVQETRFDERYLIGSALALAGLVASVTGTFTGRRAAAALALGLGVTLASGAVSFGRARYYADSTRFFAQWLATDPGSPNAHNGVGVELGRSGRAREALEEYELALRLRPDHPLAHNNAGVALTQLGRAEEAIGQLTRALELRPSYVEARFNLGNALALAGRAAKAEAAYRDALRARPDYVKARNNYGALLAAQGRNDEALAMFWSVLELDPDHAGAHVNLGILLGRTGRLEAALPHYERALELEPQDAAAHYNLAAALHALGREELAAPHAAEALRLRPDWAAARELVERIGRPRPPG